jgi:hypothetical protein
MSDKDVKVTAADKVAEKKKIPSRPDYYVKFETGRDLRYYRFS